MSSSSSTGSGSQCMCFNKSIAHFINNSVNDAIGKAVLLKNQYIQKKYFFGQLTQFLKPWLVNTVRDWTSTTFNKLFSTCACAGIKLIFAFLPIK